MGESCLATIGCDALTDCLGRVTNRAVAKFDLGRDGIFVYGRYLKFSRRLPQSPWVIDGERKGEGSVEEHIIEPLSGFLGSLPGDCHFHAEGREDMDVRMLVGGRPFVVEVKNVRRTKFDVAEVERIVNAAAEGNIIIRKLERCLPSAMAALQRDAENHRKTYVCICWSKRVLVASDLDVLSKVRDLEILQKSPLRVAHRRGNTVRPRTLHWIQGEIINPHYFRLRLSTQAGMYVKEFVHGDLGRTTPSLRSLLDTQMEILQLDVEGLEDDAQ